jgi:hypothetical protein
MQAVPIPQLALRSQLVLAIWSRLVGSALEQISLGQAASLINA